MAFDYETGVLAALLVSAARQVYALSMRASRLHTNIGKIGLRQSYVTGRWKRGGSLLWEVPLSLAFSAVFILLSWVGFALEVTAAAYEVWKRSGAPQAVKEIQWKLRNFPFSPRQVAELQVAMMEAVLGKTASPKERARAVERVLSLRTVPDDDAMLVLVPTEDGTLVVPDRDEDGIYTINGRPV
ncbi:hypothetical protein [Archangium sp.]|uniref:hypothetical protein n=1 Tax=Archangium sp. TaxID=1872627 RepID=UPI00286C98E7|nr:hypothetical protein [Archangium sp.]